MKEYKERVLLEEVGCAVRFTDDEAEEVGLFFFWRWRGMRFYASRRLTRKKTPLLSDLVPF